MSKHIPHLPELSTSEPTTSEMQFRIAADYAPVMLWITDPDGRCAYLNRAWYDFTGQREEEAEGFGWLDATHPDDKPEAERVFLRANELRQPFRLEYRLRRADGVYRWAIDAASPRFGVDGNFLGYVGSVIDIGDRREAELALAKNEERLRLATENADIGFWDVDTVNDVLIWPPRVKAMFGISADVPVSLKDFYAGVHPDDRAETAAAFEAACDPDRRSLYDVEYRTVGKEDGIIRWVAAKGRGLFDENGRCLRVVGTAIDISNGRRTAQALEESEERFRQMANAVPALVWVANADCQAEFFNQQWYDYTGAPRTPISVPEVAASYVHPDDAAPTLEAFDKARSAVATFVVEHRIRSAQGDYRWFLVRGEPHCDPRSGEILKWSGASVDIHDRKRAEAALRESEERYRTLFEAIDAGFCIVELKFDGGGKPIDYRLVEVNPAFERQTGVGGGAGHWVSEVAPGLEQHWFDTYGRVALTGEPARFENFAEPFGRYYDVYAFRTGDPRDHRVAILFNDITQRRAAEMALQEINSHLEQQVEERTAERDRMWEISPDLMAVLSLDGYYRRINPAWLRTLDYRPEDVVGRFATDFTHPDDLNETAAALASAQDGMLPSYEYRFRHKDGTYRWIQWVAAPGAGEIFAIGRHVTAEKEQAEALARAEEALRQSQKMEAVGQLTGGLAHDFNNLLAGISGSLELMQTRIAQGRSAEIGRYLEGAQDAAKRAAALTHRLLAFSRRQTLDPKPTDIARLVAAMEELVVRTVGPSMELATDFPEDLWPTLVDQNQLESAVLNLCINARDAMPDGGRILVKASNLHLDAAAASQYDLAAGDYVALSVSDRGVGMPPEVKNRVFEPFFTTKPIGVGTGLGLSMVFGFAKQSGGQVRVHSHVGEGTSVTILLPRHGTGEAEQSIRDAVTQQPDPGTGTVLVIDDEELVRSLMAETLHDRGYRVLEAADGPSGMRILRGKGAIDLLITDVGLPNGMNGRQIADAGLKLRPDLKVLFVTGYADAAVLQHGHLEPAMQVLTKPFSMEVMAQRVNDMLSNEAGATGEGGAAAG